MAKKFEVYYDEYWEEYAVAWDVNSWIKPDEHEYVQFQEGGKIFDMEPLWGMEKIGEYSSLKRAWFAVKAFNKLWKKGDPRLHPWYTKRGICRKGGIIL